MKSTKSSPTQKIESEILIQSNYKIVWNVLTDFTQYPNWNPFINKIKGNLELGSKLKVSIHHPMGLTLPFQPKVTLLNPYKELRWLGKFFFKGLLDGEHYFILESLNYRQTKFIQGEIFRGILLQPLSGTLQKTQAGFELMNQRLKLECEK